MSQRQSLIAKIRSLQALKADQKGMPEGTLAGQLAQKLIRKYAVSSQEIQDYREPERAPQRKRPYEPYREPGWQWEQWETNEPSLSEDAVWTAGDQHIYQHIRNIIYKEHNLCTTVNFRCRGCFWYGSDLYGYPYCGFFDSHLEEQV